MLLRIIAIILYVLGCIRDNLQWNGKTKGYWTSLLENTDVLINLTGKSVNCRYTDPTAVEALIPKLRAIASERSSDRVYLRADGAISYEAVVQVMGALNAGGFSNIGLVTDVGGPALADPDG